MTLEYHTLANIFPLLEGENFASLVADVKANGVREPVWLFEDKLLDGRNRYRAATEAGVECPTRAYEGTDPAAFVVSLNLHRRHLNESQRAMVAARLANLRNGQRKSSDAQICAAQIDQAQASQMLNVSRRSVQFAKVVMEKSVPELASAVDKGGVGVTVAAEIASLPRNEQVAVVAKGGQEIRRVAKDIREAKRGHAQPTPKKGPKAEAIREELKAAKERGVSMLETYARLTLTAVRAQEEFTEQERALLTELVETIAAVAA